MRADVVATAEGCTGASVGRSGWGVRLNNPGPHTTRFAREGAKQKAQRRYRRRRQPSTAGRAVGSRSSPLYLRRRGTHPGGPSGGKGEPGSRRRSSTQRNWTSISARCWTASSRARTRRHRWSGCISRRVMAAMPKRVGEYGLTLHPEKTRLVRFHRPSSLKGCKRGNRPGSFDLFGFTHNWGRSRHGFPVIKRRTVKGRLRRALVAIELWCRTHRHRPVDEQQRSLNLKLRGHYSYYGITGNFQALKSFARGVRSTWRRWLNRRSQRATMYWSKFERLLQRYPLLPPKVVQSVYA